MTERPGGPVDPDAPFLAPREEEALAQAVRPVAGRRRGATIAAVLIVLAFVVGLVRPWDFLGDVAGPFGPLPRASGAVAVGTAAPDGTGDAGVPGPLGSGIGAGTAPTCGYPQAWRSAVIQRWSGRRARVWTAVDVGQARSADDPAIPFNVIAGDDFAAIGWCAPVSGDDRPPASARGRLYRIVEGGVAEELAYRRLEPPAPTSLGELWVPDTGAGSTPLAWPPGRYVIELATPDGSWSRWLGLELRMAPVSPTGPPVTRSPLPTPSGPAPGSAGAASPDPTPGPGQSD